MHPAICAVVADRFYEVTPSRFREKREQLERFSDLSLVCQGQDMVLTV
jgi:hypothetical protein